MSTPSSVSSRRSFPVSVIYSEHCAGEGEHLTASHKHRWVNLACGTDTEARDEQGCAGKHHGHRAEQLGSFCFHERISFFCAERYRHGAFFIVVNSRRRKNVQRIPLKSIIMTS